LTFVSTVVQPSPGSSTLITAHVIAESSMVMAKPP
jgi:hypothetical protein